MRHEKSIGLRFLCLSLLAHEKAKRDGLFKKIKCFCELLEMYVRNWV